MKKRIEYPREKVRIRFCRHTGNDVPEKSMLRYLAPALWDRDDEPALVASIPEIVFRYNRNEIFFLLWPVDDNKTGFLIRNNIRYHKFPWELPVAEITPLCELCAQGFEFTLAHRPVYVKGSVALYLCPGCGAVIEDDYQGGKAGIINTFTRKQAMEKYGVELLQDV